MAIQDETLTDQETARERAKRIRQESAKTKRPSVKRATRKASPPNRVEPGFIHRKIATVMLTTLQNKAAAANILVTVGALPEPVTVTVDGEAVVTDDGREPVELLARILAHIGHRVPGIRKVEKRLEGTDARSGLASDLLALFSQLIARNEEVATTQAANVVKDVLSKRAADKVQTSPSQPVAHWPESTVKDSER